MKVINFSRQQGRRVETLNGQTGKEQVGVVTHSSFIFEVVKRVRGCLRFSAEVRLHANSRPTHKKGVDRQI